MANKRLVSSKALNIDLFNNFLTKFAGREILKNQQKAQLKNQDKNKQSKDFIKKLFIPLDGSEIRKKCSSKMEKLDKVRSLNGEIINGYHSYSTIAVTEDNHDLFLLENRVFSTKEEGFLSKNKVVLDLIDSTLEGLAKLDHQKVFLMDREFDNQAIIEHLTRHKEQPKFIIRAKHLNRQFKEGKLSEIKFKKTEIFKIKKLELKNREYHNLTLKLKQKRLTLINKYGEETEVTVIKSKLLDENKKPIFKENKMQNKNCKNRNLQDKNSNKETIKKNDENDENDFNSDFYLITNQRIETRKSLYECYLNYFIRWKIEVVFKFLKDVLGLEEFRVEDLQGIKNVIGLTFVVASYLNSLGKMEISEDLLIWLADMGGGDGKVTPFYLKKGLQVILHYNQAEEFFRKKKVPKDRQEKLKDMVRLRDV
jgi:hypothetical protein